MPTSIKVSGLRCGAWGSRGTYEARPLNSFAEHSSATAQQSATRHNTKATTRTRWGRAGRTCPFEGPRRSLSRLRRSGDHLAQLLDPLADPAKSLKAFLGQDAKTLAVVERVEGGSVKESELVVDSYYGGAQGRWAEREPSDTDAQRPEWGETTGDLYLNRRVFLRHIPHEVWRYELGGYPVLKKWLGYRDNGRRRGRPLALAELEHFRGMVRRIPAALLTLRPLLDQAYESASVDPWPLDELGK